MQLHWQFLPAFRIGMMVATRQIIGKSAYNIIIIIVIILFLVN